MNLITRNIIILLMTVLFLSDTDAQDHVVISEVMSSNTKWNYDSDFGAFSDWVELYNPTNTAIDLEGWFLTDDPENPDKWEIPGNTVIPAGGFLLFWADDRDLVPGQTALVEFTEVHEITVKEYHLNFRINRDREEIMLVDKDLVVVDQLILRDQERDVTFGRQPGVPGNLVYLGEPTPMAENSSYYSPTVIRAGLPAFSLPGGMYQVPQEVTLSSPAPGATIRYTTDGSEPGTGSAVYSGPLPVNFSQVIKARVYENGKLPGEVVTVSFIIGKETNLPVLSVSTEHRNLWGFDFGLYQNNYKNREIFAHLEYFDASGNKGFGISAGLQLFGSQIFQFDQKPLSVFFRNRYGQDSLTYPLFPGHSTGIFHSLVLRNGGNDNGLTMFRDGLGAVLTEGQVDIDRQAYRPVVVYMNGEYWGIFNIREKLNEEYLQENHGVNPDHVDILEDSLEINNGDANRYRELLEFAAHNDLGEEANYDWVADRIDLDEFTNYMGYKIWGGYKQWQVNNKYWKERLPGATWRWIAFDMEHAFGGPGGEPYESNSFIAALETGSSDTGWYTLLFRKLMENDSFRDQFLQRIALFMDTFLSEEQVLAVIDSLENNIAPEMPAHILRWGSPVSISAWQQHVNMLKEFAANRNYWMYRHMLEYFNLPDTAEVSIHTGRGGKVLVAGSRVISDTTASFTLFRSLPVTLRVYPDPGYRFTGWSNGVSEQDYRLWIEGDTLLTALFEKRDAFLLPDTVRNTLEVIDSSEPWIATGNVIIPEGDTLVIGEGVRIQMAPGASIVNKGALFVRGSSESPVVFDVHPQPIGAFPHSTFRKHRWGAIVSHLADTTHLVHTTLQNASSGMAYGNFRAAVTSVRSGLFLKGVQISGVVYPVYAYKSRVLIDSCRFSSAGTGDLINLRSCNDAVIRGCDLKGNFYEDTDAIDLDSVSGALVEHNLVYSFFGSNSDGIDLGEHSTGIVIRGNTIKSISDKGISVGQGSSVVAEQNIIIDCNQGFGIKDFQSFAYINQNTLFANRTGIAVFEKNTGKGGGAAQVENTILAGSIVAPVFVDDLSTLTISYSLTDTDTLLGYNNLHGDPGFSGASLLDFYLTDASPCINAGTPNQTDPDGTRADIGAYLTGAGPDSHTVLITELNYNSHRLFDSGDWVELYNAGNEPVDLSGWIMKGQDYGDEFVFGDGVVLQNGEYIVAAAHKDSVKQLYPDSERVEGNLAFGLSSDGELIRLYDNSYRMVHTLQYGTEHPWSDGANGKGATLELFPGSLPGNNQQANSTFGQSGSPASWHSSYTAGGTPGKENSSFEGVTGLFINELMAKNDHALPDEHGQFDDWLEVYNSNDYEVDLGGMHFMYGEQGQRRTMVPYFAGDSTLVAAGGFKLFWADKDPEQGALHLDFNLPASGGGVGIGQVLKDGADVTDWLSYGALAADVAFGRYPDGSPLLANLSMTPEGPNLLLGTETPGIREPVWQVSPNPASEYIRVDLREVQEPGLILFYSIHGNLVRSVQPDPGGQLFIDVSDLAPGVYLLRMQGTVLSDKLVVY